MDIQTIQEPTGRWQSIDLNTYDCDCDQDGFFCTDVVGYGRTPLDAIVDLLDKKDVQNEASNAYIADNGQFGVGA